MRKPNYVGFILSVIFEDSRTRSEAWNIGDPPRAIVKIEGRAGGVALTHLAVIE